MSFPGSVARAARTDELELGQFIPLHYHFNMLNDAGRTGAFEQAIDLVVPDGGRVVELGGGTGILSFFAARRAARVWCIEQNPELATVAQRLLRENGADTVEVIQADAGAWTSP
jgi:protein arginine N-methyltransferase 1